MQKSNLLTHSRQASFKTCRRQCHYSYELGIRRVLDGKALRMGSAYHAGVEQLGKGHGVIAAVEAARDYYLDCPENFDEYEWAIERETVACMVSAYEWRWRNDEIINIATEQSFELPLVNTKTGRSSRTFKLGGKIDGIIQLPDGRLAVKESKLLGDDISDDSDLWPRLRIDPQVSLYVTAARRLGHKVDCVYYDVARKPTIKPTVIPLLDSDGVKIVLDATGERVKTKDGKKWRQTGDEELGYVLQSRPMTPTEWSEKLTNDIGERPDYYFARREIARLDQDLEEYECEIWDIAQTMRDAQTTGRWYRTATKNTCDFCAYFSMCTSNHDGLSALPNGFVRVEDVHPELERNKHVHSAPETVVTTAAVDIRTADLAAESGDDRDYVPYF